MSQGPRSLAATGGPLLIALAALALAAALGVPWLIRPYDASVPWYESTAMFPRAALALVVLGALGSLLRRRVGLGRDVASEEVDAGESRPRQVLLVLALFAGYVLITPMLGYLPATALFLLAAGVSLRLRLRAALALAAALALVLWLVFQRLLNISFGSWF